MLKRFDITKYHRKGKNKPRPQPTPFLVYRQDYFCCEITYPVNLFVGFFSFLYCQVIAHDSNVLCKRNNKPFIHSQSKRIL